MRRSILFSLKQCKTLKGILILWMYLQYRIRVVVLQANDISINRKNVLRGGIFMSCPTTFPDIFIFLSCILLLEEEDKTENEATNTQ